jgi:HK97 gp10 family phage protein
MANTNNYVTGVPELQRLLEQVGRAPAKVLTAATKKAANVVRAAALTGAPKKTGALRRGLRIFSEKRKTGKKVYQVAFNRNMNHIFQKQSNRFRLNRRGEQRRITYYYPASQEYGFKLRNGGKKQGLNFIKRAYQQNRNNVMQNIVNDLTASIRTLVR